MLICCLYFVGFRVRNTISRANPSILCFSMLYTWMSVLDSTSSVDNFIECGAELSDGKQQTLSAYWRWILYTYGPQILNELGTFRFLITELVPLQLITQWRLGDTEASELTTQPM